MERIFGCCRNARFCPIIKRFNFRTGLLKKTLEMLLMKSIRCVFFSALALLVAVSAFAEYNSRGIPDSSQIRKEINGSWLKAPLKTLREKQPEIRTNSIGQRFQIWLMESSLTFSILVAPEKSMTFGSGADSQTVSDFPADSPGAWLIERRIDNGKPVRIRWYFVQDEDVFVQFSPDPLGGKKTLADLFSMTLQCERVLSDSSLPDDPAADHSRRGGGRTAEPCLCCP